MKRCADLAAERQPVRRQAERHGGGRVLGHVEQARLRGAREAEQVLVVARRRRQHGRHHQHRLAIVEERVQPRAQRLALGDVRGLQERRRRK